MTFKHIGSSEPRFLSATDILIGDMSDINYEFLLFDRPIILLANEWLKKEFPDIGIKTDLAGLKDAINRSIKSPNEFQHLRKKWLEHTISITDEKASKRYIDIMIERSGIKEPKFVFNHGGNEVRETNLQPLFEEVYGRGFEAIMWKIDEYFKPDNSDKMILVGAHFRDLPEDLPGYKVHIDHALKGFGTTNLDINYKEYSEKNHQPHIDLHICAGKAGEYRTKWLLGVKYKDRTAIGGYPKGDDLWRLNTKENKDAVYEELGIEKGKLLVTYAPAGELSEMKPGGSLSAEVVNYLRELSKNADYHILIKLKYRGMMLPGGR